MKEIRSSYIENNYGMVFRALILAKRPKIVVECGVLDGYSTSNIAHALRFNWSLGVISEFYAYDLWEEYEYKHGDFVEVEEALIREDLRDFVMLNEGDAFEAADAFQDNSVDFLHMDISNNGYKLLKTLKAWGDKISEDGMIAFEGGSMARDNVDWMIRYKFPSIRDELLDNPDVQDKWAIQILKPFPSMTLLWKKQW